MSHQRIRLFSISLFLLLIFSPCSTSAQILRNGDFETNLDWWFGFGPVDVERTADGYESGASATISNRTAIWNGIAQDIKGRVEAGKDYHVQAWVKLPPGQTGIMRIKVNQSDNRGKTSPKIGEAICDDQWTLLQGGFTYDPQGEVDELILSFDTSETDGETYDFSIDSISVTENDWRDAANERIEQIRKGDVEVNFVRSNGKSAGALEVKAVQVSQAFPFGSALNDGFRGNLAYQEFFKDNFNFATIEWFSQWKPTETVQGVEDYTVVDASVEFCEQNGIDVKGHALFWGHEDYRPQWLDGLSDASLRQEMERRITTVIPRYGSRMIGWDTNNEMLNWEYFQDRLGPSIRSWIFQQARETHPDIPLFLNEYDLAVSGAQAANYRKLADSLIAEGADVGGVGFQSHLIGRASPKSIELAMKAFEGSDLGIWFTEYDSVHADPQQRAESLDDFYRYTYSRPETQGVIMWGFWAGTHWRGADASIVDLDWTVNAAGQRYMDLMDEWTTEVEGSSDASGKFDFRGFHGSYLVTTTDERGTVNHHLMPLEKANATATFEMTATPFDQSLTLHGTSGDDLFELDLASPNLVVVNGSYVSVDSILDTDRLRFEGHGGNDRIVIKTAEESTDFLVNGDRLLNRATRQEVHFGDIALVEVTPGTSAGRITILGTAGDDVLESFEATTILTTEDRQIHLGKFERLDAFSSAGADRAMVFDSSAVDLITTDLNSVIIENDQDACTRRFVGFQECEVTSAFGLDRLNVRSPDEEKEFSISPGLISVSYGQSSEKLLRFVNVPAAVFYADEGNSDLVRIVGDETSETLRITANGSLYYGSEFSYTFDRDYRRFESLEDSGGTDRLIFRDTSGNESVTIDGDSVAISGDSGSHTFKFLDGGALYSQAGGADTSSVTNSNGSLRLVGDWNSQ